MLTFLRLATLALVVPTLSVATPFEKRSISEDKFEDFVHYWKFCTSSYRVYKEPCNHPNGDERVLKIDEFKTDTQGFISRDDDRTEIVISLAGTDSIPDVVTDLVFPLVPFKSRGVSAPDGVKVHVGFLTAYNSVADHILETVNEELAKYPNYNLAATGHSLGGATASIAAISLKQNFPDKKVKLYTYGQPRTFNDDGAIWVNQLFGPNNVFRVTHTNDPIPLIVPRILGFRHHGVEYWQESDPSTPGNFKKCAFNKNEVSEDPSCSLTQELKTDFGSHLVYMGLFYQDDAFCESD